MCLIVTNNVVKFIMAKYLTEFSRAIQKFDPKKNDYRHPEYSLFFVLPGPDGE